jgi:replicative DNA helicase
VSIFDSTPQSDHLAEQMVLGGMILHPEVREVAEPVYSHLDGPGHARIFITILALRELGEQIDVLTIASRLTRSGELDDLGGMDFLNHLAEVAAPNADAVRDLVRQLRHLSARRRISDVSIRLADLAHEDVPDTDTLIRRARAETDSLALFVDHAELADIDGLAKYAYSRGQHPISYAADRVAIAIEAHQDVVQSRTDAPASFPLYGDDLSPAALARRIVGTLMAAGWTSPEVGTAAIEPPAGDEP